VIVAPGDAEAAGNADGEGVGSAAMTVWQKRNTSGQKIFTMQFVDILIGQRGRLF
jgi:hypothetical protein